MGCGKTTVGRELSKVSGRSFLDMDAIIEEQIGKPISEIFAEEGEAHFRSLETALLRYLLEECPTSAESCVISTGGGVVMREENRKLLRTLGMVVWLDVDVETLDLRTRRSGNRPLLLTESPRDVLQKLYDLRCPMYYKTSDVVIRSAEMDVTDVLLICRRAAATYFGN